MASEATPTEPAPDAIVAADPQSPAPAAVVAVAEFTPASPAADTSSLAITSPDQTKGGKGPAKQALDLKYERLNGTVVSYDANQATGVVKSTLFPEEIMFRNDRLMPEFQAHPFAEGEAVEFDVQADDHGRAHAVMLKPYVTRTAYECLGQRHRGYVRRCAERWGFLNSAAFDGDLFVHRDNLLLVPNQIVEGQPPLRNGQSVEFDVALDERGRAVARQITTHALPRPWDWINNRLQGHVRSFQGAWGFIVSDRFAGDLFVHRDSFMAQYQGSAITVGMVVEFDVERDQRRKGAKDRLVARKVAILAPGPGEAVATVGQSTQPQGMPGQLAQPAYDPYAMQGAMNPQMSQMYYGQQMPIDPYSQAYNPYIQSPYLPQPMIQQPALGQQPLLPQQPYQLPGAPQMQVPQQMPTNAYLPAGVAPATDLATAPVGQPVQLPQATMPAMPGAPKADGLPAGTPGPDGTQGLLHITMHDWEPDQPGQLWVTKGTLVNVSYRAAHGWVYAGTAQPGTEHAEPASEGWLPQAVVKRVSLCRVAMDWPAEGTGTLGVTKGEVIAVSKEAERGWVYGERIGPRTSAAIDGWLPKKVLDYLQS
jgi:cold shock CspA family protein